MAVRGSKMPLAFLPGGRSRPPSPRPVSAPVEPVADRGLLRYLSTQQALERAMHIIDGQDKLIASQQEEIAKLRAERSVLLRTFKGRVKA